MHILDFIKQYAKIPKELIPKLTLDYVINNLKSLDLSKSLIKKLPESFSELANLQYLDLSYTQLEELPKSFGNLANLLILDLRSTQTQELPESFGNLTNLQSLHLNYTQIQKLPESFSNLTNLQSLHLDSNQIQKLPESFGNLTNLKTLYLGFLEIQNLPKSFGNLTNLQYLDLSDTELEKLPEWLGNLTNLQYLNLSDTKLEELPEWLGNLTNLKTLYLGFLEIQNLPKSFGNFINLQDLDLSYTQIQKLPESFGNFTNLQDLDLSSTQIQKLPESFGKLTNLQSLDLSDIQIQVLPESFGNLTNLQYLDLSYTQIQVLPESFGNLTNLHMLHLNSAQLQELPKSFGNLTNLQRLHLSDTQVQELPESFGNLTNLQFLALNNTQIQELPESFGNLTNLQYLYLSDTQIQILPESFGNLTNLQSLDLSNLILDEIPYNLNKIFEEYTFEQTTSLKTKTIILENTKLLKQPISLFHQDKKLIDAYFEEEKILVNEAKVIFLGDGGVGKTFIIDRILNEGKKFIGEHETTITHGVSINKYEFENIKIDFWDFGGQEIMHSMHRCFLTSRTLYIVVLDAREGTQNERIFYWLDNIKSFAPDSPVLVIINKIDENKNAFLNETNLKRDYPMFCGCERISALKSNEKDFNLMMQKLFSEVKNLSSIGMQFPKSWSSLKNKLSFVDKNYITNIEYNELCKNYNINDVDIRKWLLEWFNDLGNCFSYHMDKSKTLLKAYKILNPKWLMNAIYSIICNGKDKSKNGLISIEDLENFINNSLDRIYPDIKYSEAEMACIFDIMEKFEIAYEVDKNHKFIPTLCDIDKPEDINYRDDDLVFLMKYSYLPNNVIHKFMIRKYKDLDNNHIWYNGICLKTDFREMGFISSVVEKLDRENTIQIRVSNSCNSNSHIYSYLLIKELYDINTELNLKTKDYFVYNNIEVSCESINNHRKHGRKTIYLDTINEEIAVDYFIGYFGNKSISQEFESKININSFTSINNQSGGYIHMGENRIKNKIKENTGQLNQSFDNGTLNVIQTNNTSSQEINEIIATILKDLDKVEDGIRDTISASISIVKEELAATEPRENILIQASKLLAPVLTSINGIPVLAGNIEKLIKYIGTITSRF